MRINYSQTQILFTTQFFKSILVFINFCNWKKFKIDWNLFTYISLNELSFWMYKTLSFCLNFQRHVFSMFQFLRVNFSSISSKAYQLNVCFFMILQLYKKLLYRQHYSINPSMNFIFFSSLDIFIIIVIYVCLIIIDCKLFIYHFSYKMCIKLYLISYCQKFFQNFLQHIERLQQSNIFHSLNIIS